MGARPLGRVVAVVQILLALSSVAGCSAFRSALKSPEAPAEAPRVTVSVEPRGEAEAAKPPGPKTPSAAADPAPSIRPRPTEPTPQVASPPPAARAAQPGITTPERGRRLETSQGDPYQPPLRPRGATAGAAQTGQVASPTAQAPGRLVVFNFDNADIEVVLQATSELLVFNYVLAPGARGKKVTVQTTGRIPVEDIFPVLLTILDVNGLAAVRSGNLYRIIPKEGAVQTSTRTVVGTELDRAVPGDEVLTMVVSLRFVSAVDVAGLLRPFVPPQGAVTAHRDTNLLVLTDSAANIRRLLDIVKLVDVDVALSELQIFPLKFADAQEVAQILTQLFSTGRLRTGPQLPAGVTPPPAAPGAPRVPGAPPAQAAADSTAERPPLIVPERRSNSIIVYARKPDLETITRLVERLDTDVYGGQRIFIYFCENAKARDLVATLDAIFGRGSGAPATPTTGPRPPGAAGPTLPSQAAVQQPLRPAAAAAAAAAGVSLGEGLTVGAETRFVADEVTNSVIVTTFPRLWVEIEPIIKKLDKSPRQVLIEVLAMEITLGDSFNLGMAWALRTGRYDLFFTPSTSDQGSTLPARPSFLIPPVDAVTGLAQGLTFFTFATERFFAAVNLLAQDSRVNVLSNPSVLTAENKKAVINVSRSVPVLTSQQVPLGTGTTTGSSAIVGTQTVEYRDVGIILTVTPRIGEQGTVALEVKQELNDIGRDQVPPTNSPEFLKREAETTVVLGNSQTLVLGGLIQTRVSTTKTGIPFLSRIPVLGYLFGATQETKDKTELLILITPHVVGTAVEAVRLTEERRRLTPEFQEIMRRYPRTSNPEGSR